MKDLPFIVILSNISPKSCRFEAFYWHFQEKRAAFGFAELIHSCVRREVPCYSQFTNTMGIIKSESLNEACIKWVSSLVEIAGKTVAIDGKTNCSTEKMEGVEKPIHIVSAYISELGVTPGQNAAEGKGREIPAFRDLIALLELSGALVVADALNCTKETCAPIMYP